jgi:hypothetical protein
MGSVRFKRMLMTHPDGFDYLVFSYGAQAVFQRMQDGGSISCAMTCFSLLPAQIESLDGSGSGFFLSSAAGAGCSIGLITSNVQRTAMRAKLSPEELSKPGLGTVSGCTFQWTASDDSDAYMMQVDSPSGCLVTQASHSGLWTDLSRQDPDQFSTFESTPRRRHDRRWEPQRSVRHGLVPSGFHRAGRNTWPRCNCWVGRCGQPERGFKTLEPANYFGVSDQRPVTVECGDSKWCGLSVCPR